MSVCWILKNLSHFFFLKVTIFPCRNLQATSSNSFWTWPGINIVWHIAQRYGPSTWSLFFWGSEQWCMPLQNASLLIPFFNSLFFSQRPTHSLNYLFGKNKGVLLQNNTGPLSLKNNCHAITMYKVL